VNPVKEIGWNPVRIEDTATAREWLLGPAGEFITFQWHGDTFHDPSRRRAHPHRAALPNQAYVVGDRHLGMQCHVEMTPEMIASWIGSGSTEVRENLTSPAVQPIEKIQADMPARLPELSRVAERLYARWAKGLGG
jgi:GMP synthase-like glutamine amidotransferase